MFDTGDRRIDESAEEAEEGKHIPERKLLGAVLVRALQDLTIPDYCRAAREWFVVDRPGEGFTFTEIGDILDLDLNKYKKFALHIFELHRATGFRLSVDGSLITSDVRRRRKVHAC